jgi:Flp pilus assembly protein TadG
MRLHPLFRRRSRGQALIIIIGAFFGILVLLGLMLDLGQIFVAKAYLRRTADAASLAAASQFREGRDYDSLRDSAREISELNGIEPTEIVVDTCDTMPGDVDLCVESGHILRKLVRVSITIDYPLTFLNLVGLSNVKLTESSVSEAASMDLVLVLDVSESMTWDSPLGNQYRDPQKCNQGTTEADSCKPFYYVKQTAESFITKILNEPSGTEQDRVAIITFGNGWQAGAKGTHLEPLGATSSGWTNDKDEAINYLTTIKVYDPGDPCTFPVTDYTKLDPCRLYLDDDSTDPTKFLTIQCAQKKLFPPYDPDTKIGVAVSACGTTNLGGALRLAGNQFAREKRVEALWVTVALTDGAVNSSFTTYEREGLPGGDAIDINPLPDPLPLNPAYFPDPLNPSQNGPYLPFGFCPDGTWTSSGDMSVPAVAHRIWCQDGDAESFHSPLTSSNYDAADFTWDQAKFVSCAARNPAHDCYGTKGQGAIIFTIGLGNQIRAMDEDQSAPYGGVLLRKIAAVGDDGNPATDYCSPAAYATDFTKSCGNYFYAQEGVDLGAVFDAIASRIFTRLTK